MDIITAGSRYVVLHFRELLEAVLRGKVVVVTHYGHPKAALVPFDLWMRLSSEAPQDRPAGEGAPR